MLNHYPPAAPAQLRTFLLTVTRRNGRTFMQKAMAFNVDDVQMQVLRIIASDAQYASVTVEMQS